MDRILRLTIALGLLILAADIYCLYYSNSIIRQEEKKQEEKEGINCGLAVKIINI